jgi:hypothetical protein
MITSQGIGALPNEPSAVSRQPSVRWLAGDGRVKARNSQRKDERAERPRSPARNAC